jgi:hypothetical protein
VTTPTVCPVCSQPDEPGGCDCYGIPPHAPSSAELAALRSDLLPLSLRVSGAPITDPLAGGAWWFERNEGIGYRQTAAQTWAYETWSDNPTIARREAAAMRSRAYERSTTAR